MVGSVASELGRIRLGNLGKIESLSGTRSVGLLDGLMLDREGADFRRELGGGGAGEVFIK